MHPVRGVLGERECRIVRFRHVLPVGVPRAAQGLKPDCDDNVRLRVVRMFGAEGGEVGLLRSTARRRVQILHKALFGYGRKCSER